MECKPGVLEINAIDLIKVMKKENDTECNRMAYTMALDHLLRGAMEGALLLYIVQQGIPDLVMEVVNGMIDYWYFLFPYI